MVYAPMSLDFNAARYTFPQVLAEQGGSALVATSARLTVHIFSPVYRSKNPSPCLAVRSHFPYICLYMCVSPCFLGHHATLSWFLCTRTTTFDFLFKMPATSDWGPVPAGIDLTEKQDEEILRSVTALMTLGILAVVIRLIARFKSGISIAADDYLILLALVSSTSPISLQTS